MNFENSLVRKVRRLLEETYQMRAGLFSDCLVLGDSHAMVFKRAIIQRLAKNGIKVVSVSGATASGIDNPNSNTNAAKIFDHELEKKRWKRVLFYFGEVDVGFVIWLRCQTGGSSLNESMWKTLTAYVQKIKKIQKKYDCQIAVLSVPWPTIKDHVEMGDVANKRSQVEATYQERKSLTKNFNSELENFCIKNNYSFIGMDDRVENDNGDLLPELFNKNPLDHHYDYQVFSKLLVKDRNLLAFLKGTTCNELA